VISYTIALTAPNNWTQTCRLVDFPMIYFVDFPSDVNN
jgi:hypothetical protein